MHKYLTIIIIFLGMLVAAHAGDVDVRVRPAVVMSGQRAMLEIEADEAALDRLPQPPVVAGAEFTSRGGQRVRRGNTIRVVTYYVISPARDGEIVIPSYPVPLAGGRSATTKPVTLTVVPEAEVGPPPPANRKVHSILMIPKSTYFSGEQFPIQALLLIDPQVQVNGIEQPRLPREGFAIDRFENPVEGELTYAGRTWRSISYSARCTATASGVVTLGPMDHKAVLGIPEEGGNGFFQRLRDFPITAQSAPRQLTIKPFPANPPANFEGAVGEFTIDAAFDPAPTRADEPIAVRLTVRGKGDAAQIPVPRLDEESNWDIFEGAREQASGDTGSLHSEVAFRRILRPKGQQVKEIPPFSLVYLNPHTGAYETARTAPLALPIPSGAPATPPAASVAVPAVAGQPAALPKPTVLQADGLLLSLPTTGEPRWVATIPWTWPAGWAVHVLGLGTLATLGIANWRRKFAATEAGRRAACRKALRARLRRIIKLPSRENRLLEYLRWIEDWQHSLLARPFTEAETRAVTAIRTALADQRYARPHPHDHDPVDPSVAALDSLLDAPRP